MNVKLVFTSLLFNIIATSVPTFKGYNVR